MYWGMFAAQWLHVLLGTFWFGWILGVDFILIPALSGLPVERRHEAVERIARHAVRLVRPAAILTILTGILRGIVWGRIRSVTVLFETRYGVAWLVALVAASVTFAWAELVVRPAVERLREIETAEIAASSAAPAAPDAGGPAGQLGKVRLFALLELLGLLVVFTAMILMSFS